MLGHLLRLLMLRVARLLLGLHDGARLVRLLMGVRVRIGLLLELLRVWFHGGDVGGERGPRLRVDAERGLAGAARGDDDRDLKATAAWSGRCLARDDLSAARIAAQYVKLAAVSWALDATRAPQALAASGLTARAL